MRALICGISGQDGAYLAKLLLNKEYEVYGTSRDAEARRFENLDALGIGKEVTLKSMSTTDFRSVLNIFKQVQPDEIYNLSGQSSVSLSFEQPVETMESISLATLNLLEAQRFIDKEIKFYNAASSECFGDTNGKCADEETAFKPRSPYAVAKCASYWQVANYRDAYNMYACNGILFNHESPLRKNRFVTKKIINAACRISRGEKIKLKLGNLSVVRDWGWAAEYVEAMWKMLQLTYPSDFVIGTGSCYSLETFVEETFSALDLDWKEHIQFENDLLRPSELKYSCADPTKASEVLDWNAKLNMKNVVKLMIEAEL